DSPGPRVDFSKSFVQFAAFSDECPPLLIPGAIREDCAKYPKHSHALDEVEPRDRQHRNWRSYQGRTEQICSTSDEDQQGQPEQGKDSLNENADGYVHEHCSCTQSHRRAAKYDQACAHNVASYLSRRSKVAEGLSQKARPERGPHPWSILF